MLWAWAYTSAMTRSSLFAAALAVAIGSACGPSTKRAGSAMAGGPYAPEAEFDYRRALALDDAASIAAKDPRTPTWEEVELSLEDAEGSGDFSVFRFYLSAGLLDPVLHVDPETSRSPLHDWRLPADLVQGLLEAGFDPNLRSTGPWEAVGVTPLHQHVWPFLDHYPQLSRSGAAQAARFADERIASIRLLMAHGASPNKEDAAGETPWGIATYAAEQSAWVDYTKLHETLRAGGALDWEDRFSGLDIFLWAALDAGDAEGLRIAVSKGASVDLPVPGIWDVEPLRAAVRMNRPDLATVLLAHGADPNVLQERSVLDELGRVPSELGDTGEMRRLLERYGAETTSQLQAREEKLAAKRREQAESWQRYQADQAHFARIAEEARQERLRIEAERASRPVDTTLTPAQERAQRMNAFIDAYNRGAGNKVYQRYDASGTYTWMRVAE